MSTYDHITDQFESGLSPLAKRMYAAIYEGTSKPGVGTYIAEWYVADELGDRGLCTTSEWRNAMKELTKAFLVRELPDLHCRYELTSAAWRAHLLHERAAREHPPARDVIDMGRCDNCGGALDNVSTGIVVMVNSSGERMTVCGGCAHILAHHEYTIVAQARSLLG